MDDILAEWQEYVTALYSSKTAYSYLYEVQRFYRWLYKSTQRGLLQATGLDIQRFVTQESARLAPATVRRFVAALRAFYHWAIQYNHVTTSPLNNVQTPRLKQRLPKILTEGEIEALLCVSCVSVGTRNRAILLLMLEAGLRLAEVSRLIRTDVDLQHRTIRVMGKGGKERMVPLTERLHEALGDWIYTQPGESTRPLFPGNKGGELKPRAIGYVIHRVSELAGLERRLSPHLLRHTFATRLLRQGVNLRVVQELLGHTNIATTQIYTHVYSQDMAEAIQKLN